MLDTPCRGHSADWLFFFSLLSFTDSGEKKDADWYGIPLLVSHSEEGFEEGFEEGEEGMPTEPSSLC